ncbi:hypothetical protein [Streptomyces sp. NPDC059063]|uniref:hypothetical protein n=1 Tax=unclassified Streptomyces TaxID=2593676 RepID=UPI003689E10E
MAYEALIAFTRAQLAELGLPQPQYWLLRNLSKNDISPDGLGPHIPAIRDRIHQGIDDRDYVTTMKVLQQMMRNTGSAMP